MISGIGQTLSFGDLLPPSTFLLLLPLLPTYYHHSSDLPAHVCWRYCLLPLDFSRLDSL